MEAQHLYRLDHLQKTLNEQKINTFLTKVNIITVKYNNNNDNNISPNYPALGLMKIKASLIGSGHTKILEILNGRLDPLGLVVLHCRAS